MLLFIIIYILDLVHIFFIINIVLYVYFQHKRD